MYITKETLAQALLELKGTAHPLLKVWLTIKAMGLEADKPVLIDTKNSTETLKLLFHSGDPSGRFYIPFSPTPSDEWMKGDASRSIIQTTIKKWFDGTITTVDPRSYLTITRANRKYKIELAPSYPQGLGEGQNGFSRSEGQMLAVPIVQFAVWVFCREAIPDDTANVAEYLCLKLRNLLHLSSAEESRVFKDTPFAISTSEKALTDANIFELCGGSAGMSNINCGWCDEYLAAIRTKPFVLLAGISGTGKSRLVRQLARGCCPDTSPLSKEKDGKEAKKPGNFELIPVRPNWHDSTELMGYVTRLTDGNKPKYVIKPFVKFLVKAAIYKDVPFFLCLDEMNLAPVEQYFAEYLSIVETRKKEGGKIVSDVLVNFDLPEIDVTETVRELMKDWITVTVDGENAKVTEKVYGAKAVYDQILADKGMRIPRNFIVMGTVNMDETTCSFSRKVLDRAMTFELNDVDMDEGLAADNSIRYGSIRASDAFATDVEGSDFYTANKDTCEKVKTYLIAVNKVLDGTPFKFAYRSRNEIMLYCIERTKSGIVGLPQALDEATSMKILSRIEGDEQKLLVPKRDGAGKIITGNGGGMVCLLDDDALPKVIADALKAANGGSDPNPPCTVCAEKLAFMKGRLAGGFTNFFV